MSKHVTVHKYAHGVKVLVQDDTGYDSLVIPSGARVQELVDALRPHAPFEADALALLVERAVDAALENHSLTHNYYLARAAAYNAIGIADVVPVS